MEGERAARVVDSVEGLIGHTPVLAIRSPLVPEGKRLYLKIESANPTLSVKDRTALALVQAGFASGRLRRGGTLIESTSGNLGKSLAMLGAAMGFRVIVVVDPKAPRSAMALYRAFGAEVILVDTPDASGGYQQGRIAAVKAYLDAHPDAYWPNQYENPANPDFHHATTAQEILDADCAFDTLVGAISTGGHLSGIARRIREARPDATILACDAVGSAIFRHPYRPYLINGIGLGWRSRNIDTDAIDRCTFVGDAQAISTCRHLARRCGLLVGGSGGAVAFAALAHLHGSDARIALGIVPDAGANYLDQIYDDAWLHAQSVVVLDDDALRVAFQRADSIAVAASRECVA